MSLIREIIIKDIDLLAKTYIDKDDVVIALQPNHAYLLPQDEQTHYRYVTDNLGNVSLNSTELPLVDFEIIPRIANVTLTELNLTDTATDEEVRVALASHIEGLNIEDKDSYYFQVEGFKNIEDSENIIKIPSATYSELGITPISTIEEKQTAIATFLQGYNNLSTDILLFMIKGNNSIDPSLKIRTVEYGEIVCLDNIITFNQFGVKNLYFDVPNSKVYVDAYKNDLFTGVINSAGTLTKVENGYFLNSSEQPIIPSEGIPVDAPITLPTYKLVGNICGDVTIVNINNDLINSGHSLIISYDSTAVDTGLNNSYRINYVGDKDIKLGCVIPFLANVGINDIDYATLSIYNNTTGLYEVTLYTVATNSFIYTYAEEPELPWGGLNSPNSVIEDTSLKLVENIPLTSTITPLTSSGNSPWVIQSDVKLLNQNTAKSGAITHSQSSTMTYNIIPETGTQAIIYYKVSSEGNYDIFNILLNGVSKSGAISGNIAWTKLVINLIPGIQNTLTFTYSKDSSVSTDLDAAFISNLTIKSPNGVKGTL